MLPLAQAFLPWKIWPSFHWQRWTDNLLNFPALVFPAGIWLHPSSGLVYESNILHISLFSLFLLLFIQGTIHHLLVLSSLHFLFQKAKMTVYSSKSFSCFFHNFFTSSVSFFILLLIFNYVFLNCLLLLLMLNMCSSQIIWWIFFYFGLNWKISSNMPLLVMLISSPEGCCSFVHLVQIICWSYCTVPVPYSTVTQVVVRKYSVLSWYTEYGSKHDASR